MATSFSEATKVKQIDSHTYEGNLQNDWCIGTVPHGGYVTSCILQAAKAHFTSTHKDRNQPHSMTVHMEFPRRTEIGPCKFIVKDVKLGRQTSTVHVTLNQHGQDEVLAYITQSNLEKEEGASFPTGWTLSPPPGRVNLAKLKRGTDENWVEQKSMPFEDFRKASSRVRFWFPRDGQVRKSVTDQWITLANGDKFTTESLGYVADMFPQVVEAFREDTNPYEVQKGQEANVNAALKPFARFWYPTLVLNLDIKKALPEEGVEWLYCRILSKQISRGRLDIEVVVRDSDGDLVALSHHVTLVLSASRNMAARTRGKGESKI